MRRNLLLSALPYIACILMILHLIVFINFTIDDAYITFSYSKNFVEGHGLVFTRGSRVEATSSMLWAVILIPFEAILNQGAVIGSKILGIMCAIATLISSSLLVRHLLRRSDHYQACLMLFSCLLAGASPFIVWSTYGMENGLVAFLFVICVYFFLMDVQQGTARSALLVFLIETVRPEGFIYIGLFSFMRLLLGILPSQRNHRKSCLFWFLILSLCLVLYEIFGLAYFGHLFPNTVRAKVEGMSLATFWKGIRYVSVGSAGFYSVLLILTVQLVALRLWFQYPRNMNSLEHFLQNEAGVLIISALLITHWIFVISVGGDWMVNARFLSHTIPLLLVLFVLSLWQAVDLLPSVERSPKLTALVWLVALNLLAGYWSLNFRYGYSSYERQKDLQIAEERALTGMIKIVNSLCKEKDAVLACSDVGRAGYMFKGRVLDWWGLADEEIARLGQSCGRVDPYIVLRHHPEFLILYSNEPKLTQGSMEYDMARFSKGFYHIPGFLSEYQQIGSLLFWDYRWHVLFQRKANHSMQTIPNGPP